MQLSKKGIELLKKLEGCRLLPYNDQNGKEITEYCHGATIGVGHLMSEAEFCMYEKGISVEKVEELLKKDIRPTEEAVTRLIKESIGQNQFDALVLLTFNIGIGGLTNSSVLKFINKDYPIKQYDNLESAWMAWNKSQGKPLQGLTNRRKAEFDLYKTV